MTDPSPVESPASTFYRFADKWGLSGALLIVICVGGFMGIPRLYSDYRADKAEERKATDESIKAVTDRLDKIAAALVNNDTHVMGAMAAMGRKLDGIARDTSEILAVKRAEASRRNPLADVPPLLIPPSFSFCPKAKQTPNT